MEWEKKEPLKTNKEMQNGNKLLEKEKMLTWCSNYFHVSLVAKNKTF
jgi:hypothetical protein